MNTRTYRVKGMTSGQSVVSIAEGVVRLSEVTGVGLDLSTGTLRVTGDDQISEESIRYAVEQAGFELV